jgi:uncharacterized protein YkwD
MGTHQNLNRRVHPARSTRPLPPLLRGALHGQREVEPVVSLKAARFEVTMLQRMVAQIRGIVVRVRPYLGPVTVAAKPVSSYMADYWTPDTTWNDHARRVLELVNTARARKQLGPLKQHFELWYMAAERSNDMAHNQYFSHTDLAGRDPERRFREEGIRFFVAGENIAYGQSTADEVMQDWMSHPGHRANILDPHFKFLGVGIGQDRFGRLFWTQAFSG